MKCVTSFSADGYEKYGRRFLETYTEHHDTPIVVYTEEDCDFRHPLVSYKDLYLVPGCVDFLARCKFPIMQGFQLDGTRVFQFNATRFCRKVYAQLDAAVDETGWLYWLDADIEFTEPMPFPIHLDTFLVYLGRQTTHSCTSFVGFNLDHPMSEAFWDLYRNFYDHGLIFTAAEWHDAYILDVIRKSVDLPCVSLTTGDGNVFDDAFPGNHHSKGVWKLNYRNRYDELAALVEERNPASILEIGTFDGARAIELCHNGTTYVGFDLFEDATGETDEREKNVKAHHSMDSVSCRLNKAGIEYALIKGDTRQTLKDYQGAPFDFAFIDGGHSVETIRSDWNNVKRLMNKGGLVVFDDYYEGIPTDEHGANSIVADLDYTLSEMADPVVGGGRTRMAMVEI